MERGVISPLFLPMPKPKAEKIAAPRKRKAMEGRLFFRFIG
jgi:hypothetical protein